MAKSMPRAGRPHTTPGHKPAPKVPGATSGPGIMRRGAKPGGVPMPEPKPTPQGGKGS
jgi:hypothetical protein